VVILDIKGCIEANHKSNRPEAQVNIACPAIKKIAFCRGHSGHGILLRAESDAAKYQVHSLMEQHGVSPVLIVVEEGSFEIESFVSWEDIEVDLYLHTHLRRLAVVGDLCWRETAVLFLASAITEFSMDYFPLAHEPLARAWLQD
jgi:hypothetical protein